MDALEKARARRSSGQRKVLAVTAVTGAAALAVTGLLTVGLGDATAVAARTTTTTTTTTATDSTGASTVGTSGSSAVASSGGS
ncbi:MAG: hypothetical protein JWL79_1530 [Frankiales bacterium]|nr:hypothetical protein [Frankiales bacterium]